VIPDGLTGSDRLPSGRHLIYRLRGLAVGGAILHIGAHPDDEDVGLLAYMARKYCARVVYWSATRGEGGQNRIGADQEEALGIYRTWESLAARAVDGGESLFGPFYDFGFSKSGDESLARWGGREAVVREIVRAIRLVQPQVVVGRWTGEAADGHGHHQAVGLATAQAFEAAGDPARFPELWAAGLAAWQPHKLYFSTGGDWQPGQVSGVFGAARLEMEQSGCLRINTGEFDPVAGCTYQEQAWLGFNHHTSQGIGFVPRPGPFYYYYALSRSLAPITRRESSFYDDLDAGLTGLADYPGGGSAWLRERLLAVKSRAETALARYRPYHPASAAAPLLEGLAGLRELAGCLDGADLEDDARRALAAYLARKTADFEMAIAACLGLSLECSAEGHRITPGQAVRVSACLWNQAAAPIQDAHFSLHVPNGWQVRPSTASPADGCLPAVYDVTASPAADLTCPYWLAEAREPYRYRWPAGEPAARPLGPPLVEAECRVTLAGGHLTLRAPAVFRAAFPGGYRELPLAVLPPISLHPRGSQVCLGVSPAARRLELQAVARNNMEGTPARGRLKLEAPPGWQVEPAELDLSLGEAGDSRPVSFAVTIPQAAPAGRYPLRFVVQCAGRDYDVILSAVRMGAPSLPRPPDAATCVREEFITAPSRVDVRLVDVKFVPGLKYAYIKGTEEEILKSLAHFNLDFHLVGDEEMGYIDLDQFDAVVIGPNAYLLRDELRKNAQRLPGYVERGGTLIVQYQGYGYQRDEFVPYPFRFQQPHDRVASEDAPVMILQPDHFLFLQPNRITPADFEGWVRDRGLYFFGEWDHRYQPLLACHDPGEEPKQGGLLITSYGRGTYIYTGYSFFRQLPAGVPGAIRLFANLLAAPAARILERAAFLKNVPLFAFMDEEQLQAVGRIVSERWEPDGAYLCRQGDEGDEMYLLVSGEVAIVKAADGRDQVIYKARPGEAIGEMQVLSRSPRAAGMQARGDIHLLVIQGSHFRALMHEYPDMSDRVIHLLVQKLAAARG
jgi:LmbE family N-acetylglucosaminyl deacetylase